MKKKTLAGIAFCMGAGHSAMAKSGVDLQALELLQENRISYQEFLQLTSKPADSGTWSNTSISAGTWANTSISSDTWSNTSISDGTWSNTSLSNSTWSNTSVSGDLRPADAANAENIPSPATAQGVGE